MNGKHIPTGNIQKNSGGMFIADKTTNSIYIKLQPSQVRNMLEDNNYALND